MHEKLGAFSVIRAFHKLSFHDNADASCKCLAVVIVATKYERIRLCEPGIPSKLQIASPKHT
jgi:hypothetical protein